MDELWKTYAADFDSMTDGEIQTSLRDSEEIIDEHETWTEAVASWIKAGKPRTQNTEQNYE